MNTLRTVVELKEGITASAKVKVLEKFKFTTKLEFIIYEGRNRQIRRMYTKVGLEMLELKIVTIGPVLIGVLPVGKY